MAGLARRFMDEYAPAHVKPSTVRLYRKIIDNRILPRLGKRRVSDIGKSDVVAHASMLDWRALLRRYMAHGRPCHFRPPYPHWPRAAVPRHGAGAAVRFPSSEESDVSCDKTVFERGIHGAPAEALRQALKALAGLSFWIAWTADPDLYPVIPVSARCMRDAATALHKAARLLDAAADRAEPPPGTADPAPARHRSCQPGPRGAELHSPRSPPQIDGFHTRSLWEENHGAVECFRDDPVHNASR